MSDDARSIFERVVCGAVLRRRVHDMSVEIPCAAH